MQEVIFAARYGALQSRVDGFCMEYIDDFIRNKDLYFKEHGYCDRVKAALAASDYLFEVAAQQRNTQLMSYYKAGSESWNSEMEDLNRRIKW